jgi:hypothetical protein
LTKIKFKAKKYKWSDTTEYTFKILKAVFTSAIILRHFDPRILLAIKTDRSDFAIRAILLQVKNSYLKLMSCYSGKMEKTEKDYEIHNKDMLAIISIFKEWHQYQETASFTITVYSDYKNLKYFATTKLVNHYQTRLS